MNDTSPGFLRRTVSSEAFDVKLGQGVCFVGSVVVGVASWWKLLRLELSEPELFLGLLLSLCVPLLLIIVGMVLPGAVATSKPKS